MMVCDTCGSYHYIKMELKKMNDKNMNAARAQIQGIRDKNKNLPEGQPPLEIIFNEIEEKQEESNEDGRQTESIDTSTQD